MKATNKKGYTFYEQTIIDNIDLEPYELSNDISLHDKVKTLHTIFKSEYLFSANLQRYGNETNVFAEWLMGLPSVLTVPFYYHEMIENYETWHGEEMDNEGTKEGFCKRYFLNLATAFFTLYNNL